MKLKATALVVIIANLLAIMLAAPSASALSGSDWVAGNIIDDSVFTHNTSMSVSDIQNFLNQRVGTSSYGTPGQCDTNGVRTSELGGGTRAQYGASRGNPAPFTCLKDYYEVPKLSPGPGIPANNYGGVAIPAGAKSAAQLIYDAAQAYRISPKVLLVTIQKESAGPLITDDWPLRSQYTYAMGAHCPDSGPGGSANCDTNYSGFSLQIAESAALMRYYLDNMTASWWPYKKLGNNTIQYNPSTNCGSSVVNIQTYATAALYTYTPYQPNQAALDNLYGSAPPCGAYGNRNFWRMFNDWFGTTRGVPYAWSVQSVSYAGGDNTVNNNESETVTVTVRNNGNVTWSNSGPTPVQLATWGPGRESASYSSSWVSRTGIANLSQATVAPGQTGTFVFQVSPKLVGTIVENLNLVVENSQWMPWNGYAMTLFVTSAYSWNLEDVTYSAGTGLMEPGTIQQITVKARNTGSATWSNSSSSPMKLGTWGPDRASPVAYGWANPKRAATMTEATVVPGAVGTFTFNVYAPGTSLYYERFNLVAEGTAWLNDNGLTLYLQGATFAWQPLWFSPSTGTYTVPRNSEYTITMKARNIGSAPWRRDSGFVIRLGTAAPFNRGSALENPTWINAVRVTGLVESVVMPGQEGTFTFRVRAPSTIGTRMERFSLVAEGFTWLNDPGFQIPVTTY